MDKQQQQQQWKEAVNEAWDKYDLGSIRNAYSRTSIATTVLLDMKQLGRIPSVPTIIKWADGIGEPREKWLALAGLSVVLEVPAVTTPPYANSHHVVVVDGLELHLRQTKDAKLTDDEVREVVEPSLEELRRRIDERLDKNKS